MSNWSELQIMINFNGYFPVFSFSELLDVCGFHDYLFIAGWSGENKHVEGINMIYFDDR